MSILQVLGTMSIIWSVNDYFYIAGSLNAENLAGNMFVNFSLLSLTELPSVFIGQFLIGKEHYFHLQSSNENYYYRQIWETMGALWLYGDCNSPATVLHNAC